MRAMMRIFMLALLMTAGLAAPGWTEDEEKYPVLDTLAQKGLESLNNEVQNALACQRNRLFWNGSSCVPRSPGDYSNVNLVRETQAMTPSCVVSCPVCSGRGHGGSRCHVYYERSCDAAAMKPELRVQGDTARIIDKTCSGGGSTYVGFFPPVACAMGCS